MLWGCFRSGIHALALLASALVVCPLLAAKPADTATVLPVAPAWTFDLPLFTYPEITPEKAKNARMRGEPRTLFQSVNDGGDVALVHAFVGRGGAFALTRLSPQDILSGSRETG